jgi:hypothetical protein
VIDDPTKLSPGAAWAIGAAFAIAGAAPVLIAAGAFGLANSSDTPSWVLFATGLLFILAGLCIVLDYGIAADLGDTIGQDGDFPSDTPFMIRLVNYVLGMGIVGSMMSIFGWIAFGSGPRSFTTTISLPFVAVSQRGSEMPGRIAFGFVTVILAVMFVACGVVGVKRLMRARR